MSAEQLEPGDWVVHRVTGYLGQVVAIENKNAVWHSHGRGQYRSPLSSLVYQQPVRLVAQKLTELPDGVPAVDEPARDVEAELREHIGSLEREANSYVGTIDAQQARIGQLESLLAIEQQLTAALSRRRSLYQRAQDLVAHWWYRS